MVARSWTLLAFAVVCVRAAEALTRMACWRSPAPSTTNGHFILVSRRRPPFCVMKKYRAQPDIERKEKKKRRAYIWLGCAPSARPRSRCPRPFFSKKRKGIHDPFGCTTRRKKKERRAHQRVAFASRSPFSFFPFLLSCRCRRKGRTQPFLRREKRPSFFFIAKNRGIQRRGSQWSAAIGRLA